MKLADGYKNQVRLLIRTIPVVAEEACFALKGGTAINLFVRDMPRLSVDIDLVYLPVKDRDASLNEIDAALKRIAESLRRDGMHVQASAPKGETRITKLNVTADGAIIKIEVTPVLRGCVYDPAPRSVSEKVELEFGFAEMAVVSMPDLYAGKFMAALDRQHPRDLFDVKDLLAHEGISPEMRKAFIIYLVSGTRPFSEILAPPRQPLKEEFERGFVGMTDTPVTIEDLERAREELIADITGKMPPEHREFLLSLKRGEPKWPLLDIPHAQDLPAVRWRLQNLEKLDADKRKDLLRRLEAVLA